MASTHSATPGSLQPPSHPLRFGIHCDSSGLVPPTEYESPGSSPSHPPRFSGSRPTTLYDFPGRNFSLLYDTQAWILSTLRFWFFSPRVACFPLCMVLHDRGRPTRCHCSGSSPSRPERFSRTGSVPSCMILRGSGPFHPLRFIDVGLCPSQSVRFSTVGLFPYFTIFPSPLPSTHTHTHTHTHTPYTVRFPGVCSAHPVQFSRAHVLRTPGSCPSHAILKG